MNGGTLTRWVRLLRPHGNPLARGVDRVEGTVRLLAVLAALVLLPVMLVIGSLTHAGMSAKGEWQARTRYEAVATLTEDAARPSARGGGAIEESAVPAEWRLPNGSFRTGQVRAEDGLAAGARVPVWLDGEGRVVPEPLDATDATVAAVTVTVSGWLTAVVLLALGMFGVRRLLDRRRYRLWEQDWARVEPGWHNHFR